MFTILTHTMSKVKAQEHEPQGWERRGEEYKNISSLPRILGVYSIIFHFTPSGLLSNISTQPSLNFLLL